MIVGILEADVLENDLIQHFGSYTDRFAALLRSAEPQLSFQTYNITRQHYPRDIDTCDAYLITGSSFSCYQEIEWISRLQQFVFDCFDREKKLIGICFGHQLIAGLS